MAASPSPCFFLALVPPLISQADIAFALTDFSGSSTPNVVYGAQSCYGQLLVKGMHELMPGAELVRIGTNTTLTIADGSLTGLVDDTPIVVNGTTYTIRDVGCSLPDGTRILTLV